MDGSSEFLDATTIEHVECITATFRDDSEKQGEEKKYLPNG